MDTSGPNPFLAGIVVVSYCGQPAAGWQLHGTRTILLIMAPILFSIATKLGIDPVLFGIILIVNMETWVLTPPMG